MNEKDLSQMRCMMSGLEECKFQGPVLIDCPSTQFVRANLMLLRGLSADHGMPGIFISVDRPHQYMVHLLTMHQIKAEQITFIDAISRFSADFKIAPATVGFVDTPFHVDRLPQAIEKWSVGGNGHTPHLNNFDFAMIDNLAALLTYNSYSSVELFLRNFVTVLTEQKKVLIPLVIDSEKSGLLYDTAKGLCQSEVKLQDNSFAVSASDESRIKRISDLKYVVGG
jgi:hypothetical protein